jgi:hypothetical protein
MNNKIMDFLGNAKQFVADNLTHPNPTLTKGAKNNLFNLIREFPYKKVNFRANSAENVNEEDPAHGYVQYSTEQLRTALRSLNERNNIIYKLASALTNQLEEYENLMDDEEDLEELENTDWLNTSLESIVAVYNVATAAAGGRKKRKSKKKTHKKSRKTRKH